MDVTIRADDGGGTQIYPIQYGPSLAQLSHIIIHTQSEPILIQTLN